jgi:hypothetical protein
VIAVRGWRCLILFTLSAAAFACGKKGPPLAPLHLVPIAPEGLGARRQGDDVRLRFVVPAKNANGPGRVDVERIDVYAVTVDPNGVVPANRELLTKPYLVGSVEVRPAPIEGEAPPDNDTRPGPGDTVTFTEKLTPDKMKGATAPAPAAAVAAPAAATTAAAAVAEPEVLRRIYVVRGVTRGGRPGTQSPRLSVPLSELLPAPAGVVARNTEKAIVVEWLPPVAESAPGTIAFNVYRADGGEPLNGTPVSTPSFDHAGAEAGVEHCFHVRSVKTVGTVAVESAPSTPACVTPTDTFAPAAPTGLAAVPGPGVVNLIWDANAESDLDGYLILRGEAPGDTLQPLTPAPIRATTFTDTTVKPNVRYVYAVVAVDNAKPPNRSAESERVAETAR